MKKQKQKNKKPLVVLTILDGWGEGEKNPEINAIEAAHTPFFDHLQKNYPNTLLSASGKNVGLEENQMSGSETGHLNIGAGRIVKQDVRKILEEISSGEFFRNPVFLNMFSNVNKAGKSIHLMGLMGNSDSPHSHPDIFLALLTLLKQHGYNGNVFLHFFTDGRDSFPKSALEHWSKWKKMIERSGVGRLATVSGRFYAMDRTKNWTRLMEAYKAIARGEGREAESMEEAVEKSYKLGNTDEFLEPTVITESGKPVGKVEDGDGIIFFNFRSDRARQMTKLFVGTKIKGESDIDVEDFKKISFIAMTDFGPDLNLKTAYSSEPLRGTMPILLEGLKQLYVSETEKYAHVTYFINGGFPDAIAGEERVIIPSPQVRSYAEKPEMSSEELTSLLEKYIDNDIYDYIVVNFPNADMVGHTGNFYATVKAIESLDKKLARLYSRVASKKGIMLVTADHGTADITIDPESGRPYSFHTKNPVPFIIASEEKDYQEIKLKKGGRLSNVLPTILDIYGIKKPKEVAAESLIDKKGKKLA